MPWYSELTSLQWLETVPTENGALGGSFALSVQWVNRPNHDFRGFSVASGSVKLTNETVGAGIIHFALRRAVNIHWQALELTKAARAEIKHQQARCLWFTGLSGSGKSTIANLLEKFVCGRQAHLYSRRR